MTRWLGMAVLLVLMTAPASLARDPFNPVGFPVCQGGEIGFWQVISRGDSNGKNVQISLVLTTRDFMDPAYVICWVDGKAKVMAMGPEKQL